jgi:hypothetical protein
MLLFLADSKKPASKALMQAKGLVWNLLHQGLAHQC